MAQQWLAAVPLKVETIDVPKQVAEVQIFVEFPCRLAIDHCRSHRLDGGCHSLQQLHVPVRAAWQIPVYLYGDMQEDALTAE